VIGKSIRLLIAPLVAFQIFYMGIAMTDYQSTLLFAVVVLFIVVWGLK
jgi:hypothetical protein